MLEGYGFNTGEEVEANTPLGRMDAQSIAWLQELLTRDFRMKFHCWCRPAQAEPTTMTLLVGICVGPRDQRLGPRLRNACGDDADKGN